MNEEKSLFWSLEKAPDIQISLGTMSKIPIIQVKQEKFNDAHHRY